MIEGDIGNPAYIDPGLDSRAVTFQNPTGTRGAGGFAAGGRKGSPNRRLDPGERVVLGDLQGPGVIRHVWMTFRPAPPEQMRAVLLEVRYDGRTEPSIAVPCLDFFGLPHGRPVPYHSALVSAQEGRGFNAYLPMPFRRRVEVAVVNASDRPTTLYHQIDFTRQAEVPDEVGYLHVSFRRQNPTVQRDDFVIADGLHGPGRFVGCNVGVRVIDAGTWYGEGEVKVYRDGDTDLPTICGTGLEDYVGTAWGMGAHAAPYGGAPLVIGPTHDDGRMVGGQPDLVGFYRWHVLDPVMFERDLRVTIQQIGMTYFPPGQEAERDRYLATNPPAGGSWGEGRAELGSWGLVERSDDYCATAYLYCRQPQPVAAVDVVAATADIARRDYEPVPEMERLGEVIEGTAP